MIHPDLSEHRNGKVDPDEVHLALDRILTSRPFRNSNQCSGLLRYIVEHTLAGEENLLRERVIGAELFGRPADYETSEDPVVRLRVSEVRKRLAQYYLSDRDRRSVQIDIPPGSYLATFHWNAEAPAEGATKDTEIVPAGFGLATESIPPLDHPGPLRNGSVGSGGMMQVSPGRGRRFLLVAISLLIIAIVGAFTLSHIGPSDRDFRAFWAPWLKSQKPVIISVGSNAVYRLQYDYIGQYSKEHGLEGMGQEFYVPLGKGDTPTANQFFPAYNSYVALGDVNAVSSIVATLTREKRSYQERFPDDISFAELRNAPAILVGGFNNSMTLELSKHLQFVMRNGNEIDDTLTPGRKWLLNVPGDAHETADYAIITRIVKRNGDSPVISVAGLGQYGTIAAADLICSPANIKLVTDKLPKDWPNKNLQAVLRISVVDFKPTVSEIVALRSW